MNKYARFTLIVLFGIFIYMNIGYSNDLWPFKNSADTRPSGAVLSAATAAPQWDTYINNEYGFSVKYPGDWVSPQEEKYTDPDFNYIFRASFGTEDGFNGLTSEGFNVFVYPGNVCLSNTDTIQAKDNKPDKPLANSIANETQRNQTNNSDCVSHKIAVNSEVFPHQIDAYQYVGTNYTFVVIPFLSRNEALSDHIQKQFDEVVKTFSVLPQEPIKQPQNVQNSKPRATLPGNSTNNIKKAPFTPVRPQGTMTCPDPSQKPAYSKTKGKHMDEDCCPDPDEWPNPKCIYKAADYGIMLVGPSKKKK